jgi:hypothetical protein
MKENRMATPQTSTPKAEPESPGARLIRESAESRTHVVAGWKELLQNLGIQGRPMGAKEFRAMLVSQGFDPHNTAFSREIIAMREE